MGGSSSSAPVSGDMIATGGASPADVQRRIANMERLLVHFVGNISMDAQTLQQLADSLDDEVTGQQGRRRSQSKGEGAGETESNSSDQVKMDDITVQPLENNVTRELDASRRGHFFDMSDIDRNCIDYSGEFSHWNFSMRIKNWIEKSGPYRTVGHSLTPPFY